MRARRLSLALLFAACGGTLDVGPTDATGASGEASTGAGGTTGGSTSGSTGTSTGTSSSTSGGPTGGSTGEPDACANAPLISGEGAPIATGNTAVAGALDTVTPSCGAADVADALFRWTAPTAGSYRFDTEGSSFDTVLALFTADCAQELACDNDGASGTLSSLTRAMAQGEEIIIAVDGSSEAGAFQLNIQDLTCPSGSIPAPLGDAMVPFNTGALDQHMNACGGDGFGDVGFTAVADADAFYQFKATPDQPSAQVSVSLYDQAACQGTPLACGTSLGFPSTPGPVGRYLKSGDTVTVVVDGLIADEITGTLSVTTPTCPLETFPDASGTSLPFLLPSSLPTMGGACGPPGYSAHAFGFMPSTTAFYSFEVTCDTQFKLYMLDGGADCSGDEVQCALASQVGMTFSAALTPTLDPGQDVTLVIDTLDPNGMIASSCTITMFKAIP